jgi:hypothetical protein
MLYLALAGVECFSIIGSSAIFGPESGRMGLPLGPSAAMP